MERFSGLHVRVRSRLQGTYLHADENGVTVSLSADRTCLQTVWRVEAVHLRYLRGNYVSLQGAAYGRYLAVSPENGHGHFLCQRMFYGHQNNEEALWMALKVWGSAEDTVLIRHCRYKEQHIGVTVENPSEFATHWIAEIVLWQQRAPVLTGPVPHPRCSLSTRTILYAPATQEGMIAPTSWRRIDFTGRSVLELRTLLAGCLGETDPSEITLCIWTGYKIPRVPLVVDLPANRDPLAIAVLSTRSRVARALVYPNVDAP